MKYTIKMRDEITVICKNNNVTILGKNSQLDNKFIKKWTDDEIIYIKDENLKINKK